MSAPSHSEQRHRNFAILVLVNLLWAAQYPAYKVASDHMSVATLNFWCFLFASVLLLPFLLLERRRTRGRAGQIAPRPRRTLALSVWQFSLVGVLGILPPSVMLSAGIERSTASNAAVLSLTIPLLMTLLGVVMLGEKMTGLRILSLSAALIGTLFASRSDLTGDLINMRMLWGNVLIILGGLGSAFYNTYSKKLFECYTELEVLIGGYVVAFVGCALLAAIFDPAPLYRVASYPLSAWLSVLVLAALSWGVAMVLWMWVLNQLQASQVAVSIYLLSIFGVLLSALALHERPNPYQICGGALVFLSTYLVSDYEARKARKAAPVVSG